MGRKRNLLAGWVALMSCNSPGTHSELKGDGGPAGGICNQNVADGSASSAEPPSCAPDGPGTTQCGPSAESCCTSPEVPGGTYFRNYYNNGKSGPTQEAHPATVSNFRLDKYLVTVGRFRRFVEAWQC